MKVLQVISTVSNFYGGTTEVFSQLCKGLVKIGVNVDVVTTNDNGPGQPRGNPSLPEGVNGYYLPISLFEKFKYSHKLHSWLVSNIPNYDLIHCHSLWSYFPAKTAQISKMFNIPYLVSPHGMLSPYTFSRNYLPKKLYWHFIEKKFILNASGLLASSNEEKKEIIAYNKTAKIEVIPHGLPDEAYSSSKNSNFLRKKYKLNPNTPILLFFSRLHPKKGLLDILLPALVGVMHPFYLVVCGDEDNRSPGYLSKAKQFVDQELPKGSVFFEGFVEPENRWSYFDSSDLFLLPSLAENFGIVVIESMARGTPVLISEEVQAGEIVTNHHGGKILKRDIDNWRSAIIEFIKNPLPRVRYECSWSEVCKKTNEFYRSILDSV